MKASPPRFHKGDAENPDLTKLGLNSFEISKKREFEAQKVFLTYSNLPLKFSPQQALDRLTAIVEQKSRIKHYCISSELHKNGKRSHIHAYLKFEDKIRTSKKSFYDFEHYGNRHPNVQTPKNFFKLIRYIQKDKNYITNLPEDGKPMWYTILQNSDRETFLEEILWENGGELTSYANISILKELHQLKWEKKNLDAEIEYLQAKIKRDQERYR